MKNTIIALSILALFAACGGKNEGALETKRAELDSLQSEMTTLKAAIAEVQAEIIKLDTNARPNAIAVMTKTVTKGQFKNPFDVQALVQSDNNVMISPEVPGRLVKIFVKEGQQVSRGQVVASMDGSTANSQIAELEGALSLAKTNYDKLKNLWDQNIGSEMQYLQAKNQYESLQNSITTARTQAGKYTLRSPISGTVDAIMSNEGELVGSMTGGPVMRIVNMADIKLKANVSEAYVGKIKKGQQVKVYYPSLKITTMEIVSAVGNVIDLNNRTYSVYVTPRNSTKDLKPNMLAIITAYDFEDNDAISVPTKLVRNDGNNDYILTVKMNGEKKTVEKTAVVIEQEFASETIISSGLESGQEIITEGYNSVIEGDEVKIVTE
jgi:RND family efflux transporter MFP subunit|tara:strand:+ start:1930 stop:3072 length:1143 start_codon:yes stop_codon:yes gene_type:complete